MERSRQGEAGVGLVGSLFWIVLLGGGVWFASKLVPLYYEYWNIQTVFREQIHKGSLYETPRELERVVVKELQFQGLDRLDAEAIEVKRDEASGRYRVSARYEGTVWLTQRMRLVVTFTPEAKEGG